MNLLHTQAKSIGMSLKSFYGAALEQVEDQSTEAPEKEVALELEEDNSKIFKGELRKRSKN